MLQRLQRPERAKAFAAVGQRARLEALEGDEWEKRRTLEDELIAERPARHVSAVCRVRRPDRWDTGGVRGRRVAHANSMATARVSPACAATHRPEFARLITGGGFECFDNRGWIARLEQLRRKILDGNEWGCGEVLACWHARWPKDAARRRASA